MAPMKRMEAHPYCLRTPALMERKTQKWLFKQSGLSAPVEDGRKRFVWARPRLREG